jgi:hypothetical protein
MWMRIFPSTPYDLEGWVAFSPCLFFRIVCVCALNLDFVIELHMFIQVDVTEVASSIDMLKWLVIGSGDERLLFGASNKARETREMTQRRCQSWEACLYHHRCRTLVCPERPCEGLGSIMRWLWDARSGQTPPGELADRILLPRVCLHVCCLVLPQWFCNGFRNV